MISTKTTLLAVTPALLALLVACSSPSKPGGSGGDETSSGSSSGAGGGCQPYQVPAGTDLTTPTVSLQMDVVANVFNSNCGLSTCHGTPGTSTGNLFLGSEAASGSDSATVRTGLVGVASGELPSMPYVTAGDATKSYLMHKMDGDQCQYDDQCVKPSCLADMPNGGATLPVATRDIVRRWIAQGALDN